MATILIVEDNPANLKLAVMLLEHGGHTVLQAEDGIAGLQLARAAMPDLVLMDIQMPGLDGLEVTRQLRADPATAGMKIVALTALAMKGDAEHILEAGCDAYIAKPFRYQSFLEQVAGVLGEAVTPSPSQPPP